MTVESTLVRRAASRGTRRSLMRVVAWVALVGFAVGWLVLLRPMSLGGPASYLVVAGVSMEPHLHTGDFVIVHHADNYVVGDVVAYPVPDGQPGAGSVVIHRIIDRSGERFIIQGDNKDRPDPWRPTAREIIGKSWLEFPGSGRYLLALRSPVVLGLLVGIAATYVAYGALGRRPPSVSQESESRRSEASR